MRTALIVTILFASTALAQTRAMLYSPEATLLAEAQPAVEQEYIWFANRPVAQFDGAASEVRWTFSDHLATPVLQTGATGAVAWRVEAEPYGEVAAFRAGATLRQPLRFPGQEAEGGGLAYNVNRWYRTGWGRYTQADPLSFSAPIPRRFVDPENAYQYARATPLSLIDPLGLCSCSDDCPGGEWIYDGVGGTVAAVMGLSYTRGTYTCLSNPRKTLPVTVVCGIFGPIATAGVGVETATPFTPGACGCNEGDLLGKQTAIMGSAGPFGASVSGCGKGPFSIGDRTATVSMAKSIGAGLGYVSCEVMRRLDWSGLTTAPR